VKPFAMTQLIVQVDSENTATAIKQFVSQFADASIEATQPDDVDYQELYGIDQTTFNTQLNIGIAQSVLGVSKPWHEVKAALLAKIGK
jgi:hypothetical protein